MLQFHNHTPFEATIFVSSDPDGIESIFTIVKATLTLGRRIKVAEEQLPLLAKDEHFGDPAESSLKAPGDIGLVKPGTDVLLVGSAYAPGGNPTREMGVSLRVGSIDKTVRVFGDRVWESGVFRTKASEPQPFERMPLVWERAFGGTDGTEGAEPQIHACDRNPLGRGFRVDGGRKPLDGMQLPNLEDPSHLIESWEDRPPPAGFAPICPHWQPRRSYAGTYDEPWQKQRAPFLPEDFDPRFFQTAPVDQIAADYLQGDEEFEVLGATPSGQLRFRLPGYRLQITYRLDNTNHPLAAPLDTVLIEPDAARLVLLWRTVLPCDKKVLRVRAIEAAVASYAGVA